MDKLRVCPKCKEARWEMDCENKGWVNGLPTEREYYFRCYLCKKTFSISDIIIFSVEDELEKQVERQTENYLNDVGKLKKEIKFHKDIADKARAFLVDYGEQEKEIERLKEIIEIHKSNTEKGNKLYYELKEKSSDMEKRIDEALPVLKDIIEKHTHIEIARSELQGLDELRYKLNEAIKILTEKGEE